LVQNFKLVSLKVIKGSAHINKKVSMHFFKTNKTRYIPNVPKYAGICLTTPTIDIIVNKINKKLKFYYYTAKGLIISVT
jgi:hypothetical protein